MLISKSINLSEIMLLCYNRFMEDRYTFQACVDASFNGKPGELRNALPCFSTIEEALSHTYTKILIRNGTYREKLTITLPDVHLEGTDCTKTIIVFDDCHNTSGKNGVPIGTSGSATCTIQSPNFSATNITFANDFDYPRHARSQNGDVKKQSGLQAVALRTIAESDRTYFSFCRFIGWQDTLLLDAGSALLHKCTIAGHIDYIFGSSNAVFSQCNIISRKPPEPNEGIICAPSTWNSNKFGFLFDHCILAKENASIKSNSVWLGRPWHPQGDPERNPSACFVACLMDNHIKKDGWTLMHSRAKNGIKTTWYPWDARLSEFGTSGPGAAAANKSRMILSPHQSDEWNINAVLAPWDIFKDYRIQ
jgi:pectinesterase